MVVRKRRMVKEGSMAGVVVVGAQSLLMSILWRFRSRRDLSVRVGVIVVGIFLRPCCDYVLRDVVPFN